MKKNQGSVVIYIVLLMFVLMTSAAIALATVLSKHIRASENYLFTEQSFAAANSSIEHMLFKISKQEKTIKDDVRDHGSITYNYNGNIITIEYKGEGCATEADNQITPHLSASGTYKGLVRRIDFGGGSGECR